MESRLSAGDHSVNAPVGDEIGSEWQDYMEDARPVPEEAIMEELDSATRRQWLSQAMQDLTDRERMIIDQRRLTDETVTLAVLGDLLGISKERVRQIEHQALGKLRRALMKLVGDPVQSGLIPTA